MQNKHGNYVNASPAASVNTSFVCDRLAKEINVQVGLFSPGFPLKVCVRALLCRVCVEGMHVCVCVCVLSKVLCSVCCSLLVIFLHYNNPRRPFKRSIFFSFIFSVLASSPFSLLPYLSFPSLFFFRQDFSFPIFAHLDFPLPAPSLQAFCLLFLQASSIQCTASFFLVKADFLQRSFLTSFSRRST